MQDYRVGDQNERYNAPGAQVVLIKGNDGIEVVSVPGLTQYFTNLSMTGRDCAYYQITYLDFPINDSLIKTFRSKSLKLTFNTLLYFKKDATPIDVADQTPYGLDIELDLTEIQSPADLVDQLNNAVYNTGNVDTEYAFNMMWKAYFAGFSYSQETKKITLALFPPRMYDPAYNGYMPYRLVFSIRNDMTGR
jgi:hypothetical protein